MESRRKNVMCATRFSLDFFTSLNSILLHGLERSFASAPVSVTPLEYFDSQQISADCHLQSAGSFTDNRLTLMGKN
jgi:hypothetical protein